MRLYIVVLSLLLSYEITCSEQQSLLSGPAVLYSFFKKINKWKSNNFVEKEPSLEHIIKLSSRLGFATGEDMQESHCLYMYDLEHLEDPFLKVVDDGYFEITLDSQLLQFFSNNELEIQEFMLYLQSKNFDEENVTIYIDKCSEYWFLTQQCSLSDSKSIISGQRTVKPRTSP